MRRRVPPIAGLLVCLALGWLVFWPRTPQLDFGPETSARLRAGMTEAEVEAVLGRRGTIPRAGSWRS